MFTALAKKNKVQLGPGAVPQVSPDRQLSGADLESILLAARRLGAPLAPAVVVAGVVATAAVRL